MSAYARPERREILLIKRYSNGYPMPYPWCVKPAGTADNVTTIIMGSSTVNNSSYRRFRRRQWVMNGLKRAGDHAVSTLSVPILRSAEISGIASAFPVVVG